MYSTVCFTGTRTGKEDDRKIFGIGLPKFTLPFRAHYLGLCAHPNFYQIFNTQFNTQNLKDLKDLKPRAAQKELGERKKKAQNPLKSKDFELLLAGSGRRIRIIKAGEIKEN